MGTEAETDDVLPDRCDDSLIEYFVDLRGGEDPFEQLEVAVSDFSIVRLVGIEVELFFGANRRVDVEVLPLSVGAEGSEKSLDTQGSVACEVSTKKQEIESRSRF